MKFDKRIVVIYIITIAMILLGVTYALTSPDIGLNVTAANIGIDEANYGNTTFTNSNLKLYPILDSDVDALMSGTSTKVENNVIKIVFNVRASSNNPEDLKIIYDIALTDLTLDQELLSRYVKWRLYKNNNLLTEGNLSPDFDTIKDGRLVLTEIQEDLVSATSPAASYKVIIWLSDSCQESDITKCIDTENQDHLLNKSISGKVEVELYTGSKKNLVRTPSLENKAIMMARNDSSAFWQSTYLSNITSMDFKDNIEIPSTAVVVDGGNNYWDVSANYSEKQVLAYIEDDGSGNGTYKLTIGGEGTVYPSSGENLFRGMSKVTSINFNNSFDTTLLTTMYYMFSGMSSLSTLDVSGLNTGNVTNMYGTFSDLTSLTSINLTGFNTSKVVIAAGMFSKASNLTSIDLSSFNTANMVDMYAMFQKMSNLTSLDVSRFDTSKVTDMAFMFNGLSKITTLDLSSFNTKNATTMQGLFQNMNNLTTLIVGENFDTTKVTKMRYMFYGVNNLTSLDLSNFNTSSVRDMKAMFSGMNKLTTLIIDDSFDTSSVKDMSYMFHQVNVLTSLNVSSFDTSNVTNMSNMFWGMNNLTSLDLSNFDTSSVINMSSMFGWMNNLTTLIIDESFDTSSVTDMSQMFFTMHKLTSLDLSNFNTSNVTNMSNMFESTLSLTSLDLSSFDTSSVTDMNRMFYGMHSLTSLTIDSSFTTANVTNMDNMFSYDYKLVLDCTGWNVDKVTSHTDFNLDASGVTAPTWKN